MIAIVDARGQAGYFCQTIQDCPKNARMGGTLTMIERRSENEETDHRRPGFGKAY
jgi:hypothetical protein